eukprot:15462556-Alexandrium_andersonii.AAC.2
MAPGTTTQTYDLCTVRQVVATYRLDAADTYMATRAAAAPESQPNGNCANLRARALRLQPPAAAVSYTHLRAHETSAHL